MLQRQPQQAHHAHPPGTAVSECHHLAGCLGHPLLKRLDHARPHCVVPLKTGDPGVALRTPPSHSVGPAALPVLGGDALPRAVRALTQPGVDMHWHAQLLTKRERSVVGAAQGRRDYGGVRGYEPRQHRRSCGGLFASCLGKGHVHAALQ